jgi:hypothetical protein
MTAADQQLRVAIFREGDFWLAQGLERDVGAQGGDLNDVVARWRVALAVEQEAGRFDQLLPAPPYFQVLWDLLSGGFTPAQSGALTGGLTVKFGIVA